MYSNVLISNYRNICKTTALRAISTSRVNTKLKNDAGSINIFDRNTKRLQRQRAAIAEDVNLYDYLKDEIGFRLADRVFDIKRKFKLAADIGLLQAHINVLNIKLICCRM